MLGEVGGKSVAEPLLVSDGLGAAGYVVPDSAKDAEVVSVGQFTLHGLGCGEFAAVAGQDSGEHGDRVKDRCLLIGYWLCCVEGGVLAG